ncbi:SRPBCC family protein [Dactylosporangium sp. McL0621]|uniref:SRPBCC family protein n=1 Tax=Dactylosporangium sp. McL0621 TaxID=3415678 RepID=UPI003CE6D574
MSTEDFTETFTIDREPPLVYAAVTDPRAWWSSEIEGPTVHEGDEFAYHYEDQHRCRIRVEEAVPGRRVAWRVLENYFSAGADPQEWVDTTIEFDLTPTPTGTEVRFTHRGLVPRYECYENCSTSWRFYVTDSLRGLIETGTGKPNATGVPRAPVELRR